MKSLVAFGLALIVAALLAGCASTVRAPVIERAATRPPPAAPAQPVLPPVRAVAETRPDSYTVKRGDTLYAIALDHGLDYREIALWNGLADPNLIREGQVLQLKAPESQDVQVHPITLPGATQTRPLPPSGEAIAAESKAVKPLQSEQSIALLSKPGAASKPEAKAVPPPEARAPVQPPLARAEPQSLPDASEDRVDWAWPARGRVLAGFSDPVNKGVDIAGRKGEPVYASAAGRVVYSGEGLRGYGKLVIIKHNNTYLSAYAHNDSILVKEGQTVSKGQRIAEIGSTGTDQTKLHFEIRRLGKPVDPLKLLPERPT